MSGTLLFILATVIAIATGLAVRAALQGKAGHQVEDMGRLIGG
jgi:hypothetical protein